MFNLSSQHWRKASPAGFVRVPCSVAVFEVFMVDRAQEVALASVGRAGRALPRKRCCSTAQGTVLGRAGCLRCVSRRCEDSAHDHDHDERPERCESHHSVFRPARLVNRTCFRAVLRGHRSKLALRHAVPRRAFRVVDCKALGHPHRRSNERSDDDGSAARHVQLLPGRDDGVAGIFRRRDPQRSLAAADRQVTHIGDAARVIAGHREPLAVVFEGCNRGGFAAPLTSGGEVERRPHCRRERWASMHQQETRSSCEVPGEVMTSCWRCKSGTTQLRSPMNRPRALRFFRRFGRAAQGPRAMFDRDVPRRLPG